MGGHGFYNREPEAADAAETSDKFLVDSEDVSI